MKFAVFDWKGARHLGRLDAAGEVLERLDVSTIVAAISNGIALVAGDVIATGTPAGVGIGFDPPRYLLPGERLRAEIAGIGSLENTVGARCPT